MSCPLCKSDDLQKWSEDKFRPYYLCSACFLVSVPRHLLISPEEEFHRYGHHQNDEGDPGYKLYLEKTFDKVRPWITQDQNGLDFGCGRSKLMEKIFKEQNYQVDSFDLYFYPDETIWDKKFDFIILSEVIEHLREPAETMAKIALLLRPGGQIFIKTMYRPLEVSKFENWFYKRDLTHIQFFNHESVSWLADFLRMQGPGATDMLDLYRIWLRND